MIAAITATDDRGGLKLYAAAIEKDSALYGEHAVEAATEQVCKRFDTFLTRRYHEHNDPQRGLLIFSEGRFDARAKLWVSERVSAPCNPVGFHQQPSRHSVLRPHEGITIAPSCRLHRPCNLALV